MGKKEGIKINLTTLLFILTLILLIIISCFCFKFYNEKVNASNEIKNLNEQVESLQKNVNNIAQTINSDNSTENITQEKTSANIQTIEGTFVPNGDFYTDAGGYIFDKDGNVEYYGNFSQYGSYTISNNTIKMIFTEEIEPQNYKKVKMENTRTENLKIVDNNTLMTLNGTDFTYLRNIVPTQENILGTWIVKDSNSTEQYLKLNSDNTYSYELQDMSGKVIKDEGKYYIKDNLVILENSNGNTQELTYYGGKYFINIFQTVLEKK